MSPEWVEWVERAERADPIGVTNLMALSSTHQGACMRKPELGNWRVVAFLIFLWQPEI